MPISNFLKVMEVSGLISDYDPETCQGYLATENPVVGKAFFLEAAFKGSGFDLPEHGARVTAQVMLQPSGSSVFSIISIDDQSDPSIPDATA